MDFSNGNGFPSSFIITIIFFLGINLVFCSGFTDKSGEWNSGFYCPKSDNIEATFCCGPPTFKYCCNINKDFAEEDGFKR